MPLAIKPYEQSVLAQGTTNPRLNQAPELLGIGNSLAGLSDTINRTYQDYKQSIAAQEHARNAADLQDRIGRATNDIAQLELKYENDTDFKTSSERFLNDSAKIREKYLNGVTHAGVRQAFISKYRDIELSKSLNVLRDVKKKEDNYYQASLNSNIEVYSREAANSKTPEERDLIISQAGLAIASAQEAGYISATEAQSKLQTVRSKTDEQMLLRDLSIDPILTASKLALDPNYAANVNPVQRERYTDQAYRRSESLRLREDAAEERYRKKRGDELLKEALSRQQDNKLTREYVESIRFFVEPGEYKSLLVALKQGPELKDNPQAFSDLIVALYSGDPLEARKKALQYHQAGLITNSTLGHFADKAETLARQGGPKTQYERSRAYITNALKPSELVKDPAASARFAIAINEFDDYVASGKRSDEEIVKKTNEIIKNRSLIDMIELAKRTGISSRQPKIVLDEIANKVKQLKNDFDAKKITPAEYNSRKADLNRQRKAAEQSNAN